MKIHRYRSIMSPRWWQWRRRWRWRRFLRDACAAECLVQPELAKAMRQAEDKAFLG